MSVITRPEGAPAAPANPRTRRGGEPGVAGRYADILVALAPGASIVFLGFNAGGFFPGTVGFLTVIVLQLLALRLLAAERPFERVGAGVAAVVGLLCAFALWTLTSTLWSHATARSLEAFDRDVLYVGLFALFGLGAHRKHDSLVWMIRGLTTGIVIVCGAGLVTRLFPDVWPIAANVSENRLSFPVTYWNALGVLAAFGMVFALTLSRSGRERAVGRALAAGAVPLLAVTLYLTFSRGAVMAAAVALAAFVVMASPVRSLPTLVASVPASIVALVVAYHADALATLDPTSAAAVQQGHGVGAAVAACALAAALFRALLLPLDRALGSGAAQSTVRRADRVIVATLGMAIAAAVAIAASTGTLGREYHRFVHGVQTRPQDTRARLTDPSSALRVDEWRVALRTFQNAPARGTGAGTYEFNWTRDRHTDELVIDAHDLYLQTLSDLGLVGGLFLFAALGVVVGALARRASGRHSALYAGLFAAALAWAVHAAVDWDWEMPVTTVWLFAAGGLALSKGDAAARRGTPLWPRLAVVVLLVAACVPSVRFAFSEPHLQRAARAFGAEDCARARDEARAAMRVLPARPEPLQIVGYCAMQQGRPAEAVAAMSQAVAREPRNWAFRYGLALAQASSGADPRPALATARQLNPRDPLVAQGVAAFSRIAPSARRATAASLRAAALDSGEINLQ